MRSSDSMQVVLLGTGTPNAEPERSGPALAIVIAGRSYLVDCGPGVVRRAVQASRNGLPALQARNLERVFFTHLHSDHTAGYPDLMLTPWVLERQRPLQAFGPPGLQAMTEHLLSAYQADIRQRLDGLEPANAGGCQVQVTEIEPGLVYQDAHLRVQAFAARHGDWPAFGFRFSTPQRTIVISGDTAPYPGMVENYAGADVLVHEVYSAAGFQRRSPDWQRYHASMHTSTTELAQVALQAQPGLLVLHHLLPFGEPEERLVDEIRAICPGPVTLGNDLDVF
ncbi:MAG: MBL fold metallo-hydrolase [Chloroflexota bacterium]